LLAFEGVSDVCPAAPFPARFRLPEALDAGLRTARVHYAGTMLEQLEQAAAERARYLLETISDGGGA